jgi:hypothetical protein
MEKPTILILDDDEMWLARHERRLSQAGFKCRSTQLAKEAIEIGKTDVSVKFALIDEILYVPPIPINEAQGELQRWQGSGVIRELAALHSAVQFIVVTSAPQLRSGEDNRLFSKETAKLRRQKGVIDIIHKQDIEEKPDQEYQWLIQLLTQPIPASHSPSKMPRVLIGLGFDKEVHEAMREQMGWKRAKYLPLSALYKVGGSRLLTECLTKAKEKRVFMEMPGSKKLVPVPIKPTSQSFQILQILAEKSERNEEVFIDEKDYEYCPRDSSLQTGIDPEVDWAEVEDFAFKYQEGKKSLSSGVQVEKSPKLSRLKTAITRLKDQLVKENLAPRESLFNAEQGGYRPTFEIGIVLYHTTNCGFSEK